MSVDDVDVVMQPNAQHLGFNPALATSRLTLQHFNALDVATALVAPHNSDARQRLDHHDWPPPLLFNISYGCAALRTWGVPQFVQFAQQHTKHIDYEEDSDNDCEMGDGGGDSGDGSDGGGNGGSSGGGGSDGGNGGDGGGGKPDVQPMSACALRAAARVKRRQKMQAVDSQAPDFADMILVLWMRNARKGQGQAHEAKAGKTQKKVQAWLDSTKN